MSATYIKRENLAIAEEFQPVLYENSVGAEVADFFIKQKPNTTLLVDCEGVQVIGASFLQIALSGIKHHYLKDGQKSPTFAFTNVNEEIDTELQLLLSNPDAVLPTLAFAKGGKMQLVGANPRIKNLFEEAKDLTDGNNSFYVADLAKKITTGTAQTNTLLTPLREAGVVSRWKDWHRGGAPRYEYRSLTDEDATYPI